jgi:hypothetical protein
MTPATAYRLAGLCAVLGGLLRLFSPLAAGWLDMQALQVVWLVNDVLLLLGLVGIYGYSRKLLGLTGMVGFAVAVIGVLIVRSAGAEVFGEHTYGYGAVVWTIGMAVLAFPMLLRGVGHMIAAGLWTLALIIGIFSVLRPGESWGVPLAAVSFSLGYIAAGLPLFRNPDRGEKL